MGWRLLLSVLRTNSFAVVIMLHIRYIWTGVTHIGNEHGIAKQSKLPRSLGLFFCIYCIKD